MRESRRCPCGSGLLREDCDPAELVECREAGCGNLYHHRSNAARYCKPCRRRRKNASNVRSAKRTRQRRAKEQKAAREQLTIEAWEQRRASSVEATQEPLPNAR